jgi:hypothetical protein
MIVRFPIAVARRGDYCVARIAGTSTREGQQQHYDTKHGRYWRCEIVEMYPKGILRVRTRGHEQSQVTHVSFVLDGEAWGSRMREEIEELKAAGNLIERDRPR